MEQWAFHVDLIDPLHYTTTDDFYLSKEYRLQEVLFRQQTYHPFQWCVSMGVMYEF